MPRVQKGVFQSMLAILALGLFAALPAMGQLSAMTGTCTDVHGAPLAGATVSIDRQDISGHYALKTDKKGHFGHYGLPLGTYNVTLLGSDGTALFNLKGIRTHLGDPTVVDIDLKKEAAESAAIANGKGPLPAGLSKEQVEQMAKAQKQDQAARAANQKIGKLNQMLTENTAMQKAGQWEQAAQLMEQAIALDQTHDIIFFKLGQDYSGAKQYEKAVDALQKAIALKPTEAAYHIELGSALAKGGKAQDATAEYDKAVQLDPTEAKLAYFNEGIVLYNQSKLDDAANAFDKAIKADPTNAEAWYLKGMSMLNKATLDPKTQKVTPQPGTLEAFEKYLELSPNGPNAATAKATLEQLSESVATTFSKKKK